MWRIVFLPTPIGQLCYVKFERTIIAHSVFIYLHSSKICLKWHFGLNGWVILLSFRICYLVELCKYIVYKNIFKNKDWKITVIRSLSWDHYHYRYLEKIVRRFCYVSHQYPLRRKPLWIKSKHFLFQTKSFFLCHVWKSIGCLFPSERTFVTRVCIALECCGPFGRCVVF